MSKNIEAIKEQYQSLQNQIQHLDSISKSELKAEQEEKEDLTNTFSPCSKK